MSPEIQHIFLIASIAELLVAIPAGIILKRLGYSMWWALLCFVPVPALIGLWLLAFIRWPHDAKA